MPIGSTQQAGGAAAIQPQKQNFLKSILGRFRGRSAAKAQPAASASVKQHAQPKAPKSTAIKQRQVSVETKPKSIVKQSSKLLTPKKSVTLEAKPASEGSLEPNKHRLRNHEQSFLSELLSNTKPGRFRKFVYSLNLSFPSHPKKEINEFKSYLQESATNFQQLDDIEDFLISTGLADCQIKKILTHHRQQLGASKSSEVIVEVLLANKSENGEELSDKLQALLSNPSRNLTGKLQSKLLYSSLAPELGLKPDSSPRQVLSALGFNSTRELYPLVLPKLQEQLANFKEDPESAQDIMDTLGQFDFNGSSLAQKQWSHINQRRDDADPIEHNKTIDKNSGTPPTHDLNPDE